MRQAIEAASARGDSLGGVVETVLMSVPVGLGEPFFDSFESQLAHLLFSIPGVKGVEFGSGFAITRLSGVEANDAFTLAGGEIKTVSNHSGGIQGGISNGMPVIFRVAVKPTASISRQQQTVRMDTMETVSLELQGRHDPCIIPRVVPVIEAAAALVLWELWVLHRQNSQVK